MNNTFSKLLISFIYFYLVIFNYLFMLLRVTIMKDKDTRKSKGVAFILFLDKDSAQNCTRAINNKQVSLSFPIRFLTQKALCSSRPKIWECSGWSSLTGINRFWGYLTCRGKKRCQNCTGFPKHWWNKDVRVHSTEQNLSHLSRQLLK